MRKLLVAALCLLVGAAHAQTVISPSLYPGARVQAAPSNPAGTVSTVGVQAGLAQSFTPSSTGRVLIVISGIIGNNTSGDGSTVQLSYGTGTAPVNGAAATGTLAGSALNGTSAAANAFLPFTATAIVSGLTIGTAYWLDLRYNAVTGGTTTVGNLSVSVVEL